jgi:hypothetical protein
VLRKTAANLPGTCRSELSGKSSRKEGDGRTGEETAKSAEENVSCTTFCSPGTELQGASRMPDHSWVQLHSGCYSTAEIRPGNSFVSDWKKTRRPLCRGISLLAKVLTKLQCLQRKDVPGV